MDSLPDSDLIFITVIRKGSFSFGTFGLGWKWHQRTVFYVLRVNSMHPGSPSNPRDPRDLTLSKNAQFSEQIWLILEFLVPSTPKTSWSYPEPLKIKVYRSFKIHRHPLAPTVRSVSSMKKLKVHCEFWGSNRAVGTFFQVTIHLNPNIMYL